MSLWVDEKRATARAKRRGGERVRILLRSSLFGRDSDVVIEARVSLRDGNLLLFGRGGLCATACAVARAVASLCYRVEALVAERAHVLVLGPRIDARKTELMVALK